jgi:hypothetical protein
MRAGGLPRSHIFPAVLARLSRANVPARLSSAPVAPRVFPILARRFSSVLTRKVTGPSASSRASRAGTARTREAKSPGRFPRPDGAGTDARGRLPARTARDRTREIPSRARTTRGQRMDCETRNPSQTSRARTHDDSLLERGDASHTRELRGRDDRARKGPDPKSCLIRGERTARKPAVIAQ